MKPPSPGRGVGLSVTAHNMAEANLLALYERLGTWRAVGSSLGVSGGMAYRVAMQGYEPKAPRIRQRLGLPLMAGDALIMGTPVTCRCGRVFVGRWGERRRICPICRPAKATRPSRTLATRRRRGLPNGNQRPQRAAKRVGKDARPIEHHDHPRQDPQSKHLLDE